MGDRSRGDSTWSVASSENCAWWHAALSASKATSWLLLCGARNMPLVDGFEFLERFEEVRDEAPVVIVMFSSSERPEDRDRALAFPAVRGFLTKGTFEAHELERHIREALAA